MARRITLDRIQRDDDDATGADVRQWQMEIEGDNIKIRPRDGADFIMLRVTDADEFIDDLQTIISH